MGKLTREEFNEIMSSHLEDDSTSRPYGGVKVYHGKELVRCIPENEFFAIKWQIGGAEGGDCWGGEASAIGPEPEPEFTAFKNALREIAAKVNLSYLDALPIMECISTMTHTHMGYYGNFEIIQKKYVAFQDIWEKLKEYGYVEEPQNGMSP